MERSRNYNEMVRKSYSAKSERRQTFNVYYLSTLASTQTANR
jgi:hypothetical protein